MGACGHQRLKGNDRDGPGTNWRWKWVVSQRLRSTQPSAPEDEKCPFLSLRSPASFCPSSSSLWHPGVCALCLYFFSPSPPSPSCASSGCLPGLLSPQTSPLRVTTDFRMARFIVFFKLMFPFTPKIKVKLIYMSKCTAQFGHMHGVL